jgi:hypothetical protein
MAKCGNCAVELKFANTSLLGGGKLASGETLCLKCFGELIKIDPVISTRKHTLDQIKAKLSNSQSSITRVQEQLKKIGISSSTAFWGGREIDELSKIIQLDEEIFALVQGTYNGGQGILVATNIRMIFVDKGLLYGLKVEDFGFDKISSIQYEAGLIFSKIKIITSGNTATIGDIEKAQCLEFHGKIRAKLTANQSNTSQNVSPNHGTIDIADQLTKLAALKEQGILTQEEFDVQKKKLLSL